MKIFGDAGEGGEGRLAGRGVGGEGGMNLWPRNLASHDVALLPPGNLRALLCPLTSNSAGLYTIHGLAPFVIIFRNLVIALRERTCTKGRKVGQRSRRGIR